MALDLHSDVDTHLLYLERRATQGSETRTTSDMASPTQALIATAGIPPQRATMIVVAELDANAAAADSVTVTLQKCTSSGGAGAATLQAGAAIPGTGAAQRVEQRTAVDLTLLGTTYTHLRASVAYVDANSGGTYTVAAFLVFDSSDRHPVS